jgi:hypothetical protein
LLLLAVVHGSFAGLFSGARFSAYFESAKDLARRLQVSAVVTEEHIETAEEAKKLKDEVCSKVTKADYDKAQALDQLKSSADPNLIQEALETAETDEEFNDFVDDK